MTAQEIVEALVQACDDVYEFTRADYNQDAAAHRDAIKAALVAVLADYEDLHFKRPELLVQLEEACRGK